MIFVEQMNSSAMRINTIFVSELFTENTSWKKIDQISWHVIHVGQGECMLLSIVIRDSKLDSTHQCWFRSSLPLAALTIYIEGTRSPMNSFLSLQMYPVAELSHTQKEESVSKDVMVFMCVCVFLASGYDWVTVSAWDTNL
jgi:hypothetical protein